MDRQEDDVMQIPMWKSYLYHLQQQAPKPKRIVCQKEIPQRPVYYGREYHGAISREHADFQLTIGGEGSYLIRESLRAPGQFTLAIRFEGVTKNFKLYYDSQHYVGEKRFDTVLDLVADGLITFYLESKASNYIAALSSQSNYAESPYVAYSTQNARRRVTSRSAGRDDESRRTRSTTAVSLQLPDDGASMVDGRISQSTNTDGPKNKSSRSLPTRPSHNARATDFKKPHSAKMLQEPSPITILPPLSSASGGNDALGVTDKTPSAVKSGSSVSWCTDYLQVMGCEKPHAFKLHTFRGPHWCDFCANFLWGLIAQGVKCQDCGFNAHKKCSEKVPNDCMPDMKYVKRIFGVDLTTLVKAQNTLIPVVVSKCIEEIESRGLESEGLYRVAGFHDDVEAIRISFDKDIDLTDISAERYEDINTIGSLLKLYLRLLPIPLVTFDLYWTVINVVKREDPVTQVELEKLRRSFTQLPPAHYHTLKYLMSHLYRVSEYRQQNMMNCENLATVFAPTILRCPETDPLTSLTAVKYERELAEIMITHHDVIFD